MKLAFAFASAQAALVDYELCNEHVGWQTRGSTYRERMLDLYIRFILLKQGKILLKLAKAKLY